MASSDELTLKAYQTQLKDQIKSIYDNFREILNTQTEHINYEVQVRSAEIIRSYQSLMQLVSEIRSLLIINDLIDLQQQQQHNQQQHQQMPFQHQSGQHVSPRIAQQQADEKLIKLRDDIAVFLYELEIPLL